MAQLVSRSIVGPLLMTAWMLAILCPASAKVASTSLEELARDASATAIAHVDQVKEIEGVRVALATVTEPLGGLHQGQRFAFVAQGTWTCDSSTAVPGETVLLFLQQPIKGWYDQEVEGLGLRFCYARERELGNLPFYFIYWSGRGRIPIERRAGTDYLVAWKRGARGSGNRGRQESLWTHYDVEFPRGIGGIAAPGAENPLWIGTRFLVPLDEVARFVRRFPKVSVPLTPTLQGSSAPNAAAGREAGTFPRDRAGHVALAALFLVLFTGIAAFRGSAVWRRWRLARHERLR